MPDDTELRINPVFIGGFNNFTQGQTRNFELEISVDNLRDDMSISSNFSTKILTKSNVDSSSNWTISNVQVPKSGSYAMSVTIRSIDCFTGCGIVSNGSCSEFNEGKPFFRIFRTFRDTNAAPNSISVTPEFVRCF